MRTTFPSRTMRVFQFAISLVASFLIGNLMAQPGCAQEKMLKFPGNWNHATLATYDQPGVSDNLTGFVDFSWNRLSETPANGNVSVAADAFVGVEISAREGYEEFLADLPASGIHRLDLNGVIVSTKLLSNIERIQSLRLVTFSNCEVDSKLDIGALKGAAQLQSVNCLYKNEERSEHEALIGWFAKCPELQYLYDTFSLNAAEVRLFSSHQSQLFLDIELGTDAVAAIEALGEIPNLIGLNLQLTSETPDDYHAGLPKLKSLELINWSGGKLDAKLLDSLEQMKTLRTIRFQGRPEVSDEFVAGVGKLQQLNALSFNLPLTEEQQQSLLESLIEMKNMQSLPEITEPSGELLRQLADRSNLKSLNISGLGENASLEQLCHTIQANRSLQYLDLEDIEFTDDIAAAICGCEKLIHLDLSIAEFDGLKMKSADKLKLLNSLNLFVSGRTSGLSVLSKFPNINRIDLGYGAMEFDELSFVAEMKSLESFSIANGDCDNRIVKWLADCESLRSFSVRQDCIFNDAIVDELCKCEHLRSLSIGGFLSTKSIEQIAEMPNMDWLSISSSVPTVEEVKALKARYGHFRLFNIRDLHLTTGVMHIGEDGFARQVERDEREKFAALEGKSIKELIGENLDDTTQKQLAGKVVLVEFWGTWCGPCLAFVPELERLQKSHGDAGFQVLGIHSENGSEKAEAYLEEHPKPWPNLIDSDGSITKRFLVPSYPSLYLIGRDGKLRVARAHRISLEQTIEKLLAE